MGGWGTRWVVARQGGHYINIYSPLRAFREAELDFGSELLYASYFQTVSHQTILFSSDEASNVINTLRQRISVGFNYNTLDQSWNKTLGVQL